MALIETRIISRRGEIVLLVNVHPETIELARQTLQEERGTLFIFKGIVEAEGRECDIDIDDIVDIVETSQK